MLRRHDTSNIFSRKDAPHEACDIQGHLCSSPSAHASGDTWSSAQFLEQGLCLFQIKRVEAFGEPAVDRSEQFARLLRLPLIALQPGHAHCGAEFPRLCLLLARNFERPVEIRFCFRDVGLRFQLRNFPGHAIDLGLTQSFAVRFYSGHRFTNAAPSVIQSAEFGVGGRQI